MSLAEVDGGMSVCTLLPPLWLFVCHRWLTDWLSVCVCPCQPPVAPTPLTHSTTRLVCSRRHTLTASTPYSSSSSPHAMSEMEADATMAAAAAAAADSADAASSSSSGSGSVSVSSAAALDPQLLTQLQQHLAHTVPQLVQGNVAVFNQYCSTKETEVRTQRKARAPFHPPRRSSTRSVLVAG